MTPRLDRFTDLDAFGVFDAGLRRLLAHSRSAVEPLVISLVRARFEDGAWSGVPRFDWELRKALPEMISLASTPAARLALVGSRAAVPTRS